MAKKVCATVCRKKSGAFSKCRDGMKRHRVCHKKKR
jgi:hypothetical protein